MNTNLSIFFLLSLTLFLSCVRNHCLIPGHKDLLPCFHLRIIYSWPLSNTGLNRVGPLICRFFSIHTYYSTTWPVVRWICGCGTTDMEGCKVIMWIFNCGEVGTPNPQVVQGSPLVLTLTHRSLIHFQFIFIYDVRCVCWGESNFIFLHVEIQLFQHHLFKRPFFPPLNYPGTSWIFCQ